MTRDAIHAAVLAGRSFFAAGQTRQAQARIQALQSLGRAIRAHQQDILAALQKDLNKSPYEAYLTEIGLVLGEIGHAVRHLARWARPQRRRTAMAQAPARAWIQPEPYGLALIMSPWNYPFQLTMVPLVGALAAGNCAIVKPSAYAPATSAAMAAIARDAFAPGHVAFIEGGREENNALLEEEYDYIFFTGSPQVGRTVMEKAARHVTPLTLELGGKSPVIVHESADLQKTARRILFGKLLNSGQTCVAPDYVLVQESAKPALVDAMRAQLTRMLPNDEYLQQSFGRIVNEKHFERLKGLMQNQTLLYGGRTFADTLQIEPALLDAPSPDSPVMQEEIFGPLLPILTYQTTEEAIAFVQGRPRPLALYLFCNSKEVQDAVLSHISFGGGCVNDTILHLASSHLPFGGVGNSGMGRYHGRQSFDTFSHHKSILKKWWAFDLPVRYHPYRNPKGRLPEWLFRH